MNFGRWKRTDLNTIVGALLAGPLLAGIWMAGCGGGGGGGLNPGGNNPPPAQPGFAVRGTVYAPGRQVRSTGGATPKQATNTLYPPVVAGIRVVAGRVNNAGEGFATLVETTTDVLGGYTLSLPAGVTPGPTIVVRATNGSVILQNIVNGPVVDISPETTAAVNLLFSTARSRGVAVSRLRLDNINNYIGIAVGIGLLGRPAATVGESVSSAASIIQRAPNATTALNAVLNNAGTVGTPRPTTQPTQGTPRPTGTPGSGGPPTPPGGGGTPRPTATRQPTPGPGNTPFPTTQPTPGSTPFPTTQPTPGATFLPTPGTTPSATSLPTPARTPIGGVPTPAPTSVITPRAYRRGR